MELVIGFIIGFGIATLLSAICLWAGMKLTGVGGTFLGMLIIAAVTAGLDFIPSIGWIISTVVMYVLICKWTDANFWPDAVFMVIVAKLVAIGGGMLGACVHWAFSTFSWALGTKVKPLEKPAVRASTNATTVPRVKRTRFSMVSSW